MNKRVSFKFLMVALLLIALSGASPAAAQANTSFGTGALANPWPLTWTTVRSESTL